MKPEAIDLAKSRIRVARRALGELGSNDISQETFADHWFVFLTAWKGVYTVLEQGAKNSPQSRQWFGAKKTERRADPLLQYLFEARNDEEHGLAHSVRRSSGGHLMRATQEITELRLMIDPQTLEPKVVGADGRPVAELIQYTDPGPALCPINARGGIVYQPPVEHMGQRVDIRPVMIAQVALAYIEALTAEAEKTCKPSQ